MTHVYNGSSVLHRRMSALKVDPARAVKERADFFFFFSLRILKKQDSEAQKDFFFF